MTDLERAIETYNSIALSSSTTVHLNAWATAFAKARQETVEECAQEVESEGISPTIQHIAAKIRALAPPAKKPE